MLVICPKCGMPGSLIPHRWRGKGYRTYWRVIHYLGKGRRREHYIPRVQAHVLIATATENTTPTLNPEENTAIVPVRNIKNSVNAQSNPKRNTVPAMKL